MAHRLKGTFFLRYAAAVGAVVIAFACDRWLPWLEHPSPLFLAAVTVSAWFGGLGPGLLATAIAALGVQHFYMEDSLPGGLSRVTWVWAGTFVFTAVLINWLHLVQERLSATIARQNRRQIEFLSMVAHELRNFLHPVSASLAVLQHGAKRDPAVSQASGIIERQVANMARLVEDLLDIARINEGKLVLRPERLDLRDAIAHAAETIGPQLFSGRLHLETEVPAEPLAVHADRTRIDQVLVNLLTNAVKHTPPGGRITLSAAREGDQAVLRVRDTGSGMPPDLVPRVFDLFAQAEDGSHSGLGIGLALVRGLVEMHGGRVAAASGGPGQGSEFEVRLPAA